MALIHIYEPDPHLRSNIVELLGLEGHSAHAFSDFSSFIMKTSKSTPDVVVCSLIDCDSTFPCHMNNQLNKFSNIKTITLGANLNCTCSEGKICLRVPFTTEELLTCIEGDVK